MTKVQQFYGVLITQGVGGAPCDSTRKSHLSFFVCVFLVFWELFGAYGFWVYSGYWLEMGSLSLVLGLSL